MAAMDISFESDADDVSSESLSIADSEPYDWKNEGQENLIYIFRTVAESCSPKVDLRPLTPIIREVISTALHSVEERMTQYARFLTQPARRGRAVDESKSLLEMEQSFKFYFQEKLSALSPQDVEEFPPLECDDVPQEDESDLHVRALTTYHSQLRRDLIVAGSSLLDRLVEEDLISSASAEGILKKATEQERSREVLRLAEGLTPQQFRQSFLPALKDGNGTVAETLASAMEGLRGAASSEGGAGCRVCALRGRLDLRRLADPLLERGLIPRELHHDLCREGWASPDAWGQVFRHVGHTQRLLPVLSLKYPAVAEEMTRRDISSLECGCLLPPGLVVPTEPPHPSGEPSDIARMSDVTSVPYPRKTAVPEYPMTSDTRGLCLVVENSVFQATSLRKKRTRPYANSTNLMQEEFQRLGFKILKHSDLSAKQLLEEAERVARLDHSQHDCFACVIRSRNDGPDKIECCDGVSVGVQEVMDVFQASRCPTLAGKPKIFYVPRSRGTADQGGITTTDENERECVHPDGADFLLIESCPPGFRHTGRIGSAKRVPHHLSHLVHVLQRHAHTHDFMTCLAMANSDFANMKFKEGNKCIAPVTSTLRKALIFRNLP